MGVGDRADDLCLWALTPGHDLVANLAILEGQDVTEIMSTNPGFQ